MGTFSKPALGVLGKLCRLENSLICNIVHSELKILPRELLRLSKSLLEPSTENCHRNYVHQGKIIFLDINYYLYIWFSTFCTFFQASPWLWRPPSHLLLSRCSWTSIALSFEWSWPHRNLRCARTITKWTWRKPPTSTLMWSSFGIYNPKPSGFFHFRISNFNHKYFRGFFSLNYGFLKGA